METKEFDRATIFTLSDTIKYADGAIVSKTITKRAEGTVTLFAFDKEQGLSEHTAAYDAMVQVLDGEKPLEPSQPAEPSQVHRRHPAGRKLSDQLVSIELSRAAFAYGFGGHLIA